MAKHHEVRRSKDGHYVYLHVRGDDENNHMLLCRGEDVWSPETWKDLHMALYDLYQCSEDIKDGDLIKVGHRFEFRTRGVHIEPYDNDAFALKADSQVWKD